MTDDCFAKSAVDFDALAAYGFTRADDGFFYETPFMDGAFTVAVSVGFSGKIDTAVYDADTHEKYLPLLMTQTPAGYPAAVKAACETVLTDIKNRCCRDVPFSGAQANRLAAALLRKYGDTPDFPWGKHDGAGVLRNPETKKWYALFMTVPEGKLTRDENKTKTASVVNFKAESAKIPVLLTRNGFFPAYHMNKKTWVTAVLNDTLADDVLLPLLDESRAFTVLKKGKKR